MEIEFNSILQTSENAQRPRLFRRRPGFRNRIYRTLFRKVVSGAHAPLTSEFSIGRAIPPVIWGWMAGMLAMLVILWIGHFD